MGGRVKFLVLIVLTIAHIRAILHIES